MHRFAHPAGARAAPPRHRVITLFAALGLANLALWLVAWVSFRHAPALLAAAVLAYGFGLRHAVDADHIAAIDNVTRKLMSDGQRPLTVGLFFSLGHSTIVFALAAAVGAGAFALKSHLAVLQNIGGVVGTVVSVAFLAIIALANVPVLAAALRGRAVALQPPLRGPLTRWFGPLFRLVGRPWQIYPVGLLFGLGFDTATEIGLLTLAATAGAHGLPLWSVMLFPALFTGGMALLDTADGVLMLGAYAPAWSDPARKRAYNIVLTTLSIAVAAVVGAVELLGLLQDQLHPAGAFWAAVAALNSASGAVGAGIIVLFLLCWAIPTYRARLHRAEN